MIYKISSLLLCVPFALTYAVFALKKSRTNKAYQVSEIYTGSPFAFLALLGILFFSFVIALIAIIIL